jgi:hypothetical protein
MTSHYRHRRITNPAAAFPTPIEPGEIMVNSANRQLALGDADPASPGVTKPLIGVRFFDAKAQYAAGEFVVQGGVLYRSKAVTLPGGFLAGQWDAYASDPATKTYIDAQDAAIVTAYQAADDTLTSAVNGKVAKSGDTMSGPLNIAALPINPSHVANKQYVDEQIAAGGIVTLPALDVTYTPAGAVSSTNVQAAIAELDAEKAPLYSPAFLGEPTTPTPIANDNSTKIANTLWVNTYTVTYVTSFMQNYVDGALSAIVGTAMPKPIGTAAVGTATKYSREDHVHPSDPTRAPIASPAFTGNPTAPTPPPGDNDLSIATTAFVQNALGTIPAQVVVFSTGDVKLTFKTVADTGWVLFNDGTMGDATSGGTARANADTVDLFTLLWTVIPNIYCPVLPGGRGADAATDFAAHKTIKLPAALGRALAIAGNGAGLTARALGQFLGEEAHPLTVPELAPHTHPYVDSGNTSPFSGGPSSTDGLRVEDANKTTGSTGSGTPHNTMQPTLFLNAMVKL